MSDLQRDLIAISELIRDHLHRQKALSLAPVNPDRLYNACRYRGEGGRMCAVGVLIDEDHYCRALESNAAEEIEVVEAVADSLKARASRDPAALPRMDWFDGHFDRSDAERKVSDDLLEWLLMAWQGYHDSELPGNYKDWIEGGEALGPEQFHAKTVADLNRMLLRMQEE